MRVFDPEEQHIAGSVEHDHRAEGRSRAVSSPDRARRRIEHFGFRRGRRYGASMGDADRSPMTRTCRRSS